uniref:Uncharacterized protein LOC111111346 isoform X2 n=1 Tax=Crassostrea virginica TaxID=6565 RepID=A0A8B8BKW6_CRAVI|nr:uncharacterized protein LOC111111346 isoform X2 [Crassostrea virginica]
MDYLQLHLMIYSTILFLECRGLVDYQFPVFSTKSCPKNNDEWNERSAFINCTDSRGYMCLPNEMFTELLEFCYTSPGIAIIKGLCLYLDNNSSTELYDCDTFLKGCPDKLYYSYNVYEYPSCSAVRQGCFIAEPSCVGTATSYKTSNPHVTNVTETRGITIHNTTIHHGGSTWVIIIGLIIIIALMCAAFFIQLCYHRNKNRSRHQMYHQIRYLIHSLTKDVQDDGRDADASLMQSNQSTNDH